MISKGAIYTVKDNWYPLPGTYEVILAPNSRRHLAFVVDNTIRLGGSTFVHEMSNFFSPADKWIKLE